MKRPIIVILFLVLFLSAKADKAFRFAVVGDRTGGATGQVFEEILKEVELLDPDFVMSVGDLIEGYQTDTTVMHAQWDTILATIRTLPSKFYFTPGNHELENEVDRRIYEQRTGFKRYYSFNHENSHFIILDNSMTYWAQRQDMEPEQLSWLAKDLEKHRQMDNIFVFYHIPTYIYALREGETDTLMQIFEKYGVDVVFTGHHHHYSHYEQNGIEYINVGSSGGDKSTNDPARGHFFQYLLVTVRGKQRNIAVFKKESVLPRNVVTLKDIQTIERADEEAIAAEDLIVDEDVKNVSQTVIITVNNFGPDSLTQTLMWQVDPVHYAIRPNEMPLAIAPDESKEYSFDVTIADGANPFPIPRFTLAYPFMRDKVCTLYHLLSVKRHKYVEKVASAPEIDGRLDDPLWRSTKPMLHFANFDGSASSPIEKTEVYFAHDADNLYFAARCYESDFSQLHADVFEHDGETYYDDNVWLFFDTNLDAENYYQAIINCNGAIFDRKCTTDGTRDITWNGAWQVEAGRENGAWTLELKIAKAEFAPFSEDKWGFNMRRLQPRLNDAGYWSVPFAHAPQYFGILEFR
ncbi:MAG: metallophosphoesterase [candidate division WOR-3 bacterium]|nr:MAG: metallophosphoesterase [candidate division WOR-3 bacterium]